MLSLFCHLFLQFSVKNFDEIVPKFSFRFFIISCQGLFFFTSSEETFSCSFNFIVKQLPPVLLLDPVLFYFFHCEWRKEFL